MLSSKRCCTGTSIVVDKIHTLPTIQTRAGLTFIYFCREKKENKNMKSEMKLSCSFCIKLYCSSTTRSVIHKQGINWLNKQKYLLTLNRNKQCNCYQMSRRLNGDYIKYICLFLAHLFHSLLQYNLADKGRQLLCLLFGTPHHSGILWFYMGTPLLYFNNNNKGKLNYDVKVFFFTDKTIHAIESLSFWICTQPSYWN